MELDLLSLVDDVELGVRLLERLLQQLPRLHVLDVGGHAHGGLLAQAGDVQRDDVRALARRHLLKADQDLVPALLQCCLKRDAARVLVRKVLLAVSVLPVDPHVSWPVAGQRQRDLACLPGLDLAVGPRAKIVGRVVEGGEIDKVVVEAAMVPPGELLLANLEGTLLDRWLVDLGQLAVVLPRDLQLEIGALELLQVFYRRGVWARDEPVVHIAVPRAVGEVIRHMQGPPS